MPNLYIIILIYNEISSFRNNYVEQLSLRRSPPRSVNALRRVLTQFTLDTSKQKGKTLSNKKTPLLHCNCKVLIIYRTATANTSQIQRRSKAYRIVSSCSNHITRSSTAKTCEFINNPHHILFIASTRFNIMFCDHRVALQTKVASPSQGQETRCGRI